MHTAKKLIEVALPIKEISAESVRDKSIRHGHISTLHLWWARRPLPVCRAVVFASLVPDPLDPHCPPAFREAVALLLGRDENTKQDPYRPYDDIPWTPPIDPMEDNLRNRLQMFIGKFSDQYCKDIKAGKITPAKDLLDANSLIKWDNKNNETTLNKARKLIWVAHAPAVASLPAKTRQAGAKEGKAPSAADLLADFDAHYAAIKTAEKNLYSLSDRHITTPLVTEKEAALHQAIEAFLDKMPRVFDPFAGGGAIPLEAARLGCRAFGNDINPVAHIIQKGSLEFPQKFGKPITYSVEAFLERYGSEALDTQRKAGQVFGQQVQIANRLSFDVAFYAKKLLSAAEAEIGHLYPADEKGNKPIAYYWARVGTCSNPSCRAEVPLLKGFYLSKKRSASEKDFVFLSPIISGNQISFEIKEGRSEIDGWIARGNLICPCCKSITDSKNIKSQNIEKGLKERLLVVIMDGIKGRNYLIPTNKDIEIMSHIPFVKRPIEKMQRNSAGGDTFGWGVTEWGQMFSSRQLCALESLVNHLKLLKNENPLNEYDKAVLTYLAIFIDRIVARNNTFCVWHILQETVEHPFGRQAIPMILDFPEINPFGPMSGAGLGQLGQVLDVIESESHFNSSVCNNASSVSLRQTPSCLHAEAQ